MLPVFDQNTPQGQSGLKACLGRLRATAGAGGEVAQVVASIIDHVREHGDAALARYVVKFSNPDFTADRLRVSADELANASKLVDPELLDAIKTAIKQVREYQQHIMPEEVAPVTIGGAELGLRFSAVDSVGLCVPGGTAVLFSTLIMLAVPAIVAGVDPKNISVAHPLPTRPPGSSPGNPPGNNEGGSPKNDFGGEDISPIVLAAAHMLGIDKVYRVGGAEAVAAMAMGTETIEAVDFIAGPGNVYGQLAKAQMAGTVGIDGFYGPSEIVTIADETADPVRIAADLIAQAEHDPGKCFLVVWSRDVLDRIVAEVESQIGQRNRRDAIVRALADESCAVLVKDIDEAATVANRFAGEHVNLAVADPDVLLAKIKHAGEVFIGDSTPVAAGDYYAGPSHCLPTATTARFTSGVSVYTFLKRTGTVAYRSGMPAVAIEHVARMAEAEGLDGHAHSARVRGK
jgi:histidinol dehydrogenase